MPIDTKGPVYRIMDEEWRMIADVLAGEKSIKSAGEIYLPRLGGQSPDEYDRYKQRGTFFGATYRTSGAFHGAIMRRPPTIENPGIMTDLKDKFTKDGKSFNTFASTLVHELIDYGFCGVMVDLASGTESRPYATLYKATDIINSASSMVNGKEQLVWLTLKESTYEANPEDPYDFIEVDFIREYFLDINNNQVVVRLWKYNTDINEWIRTPLMNSNKEFVDELLPTRVGGKKLDFIPFEFFGAISNSRIPPKPPLLDLAYLNVKHWQVTVDYYHGLHFCALPTPWAAGFPKDMSFYVGPEKALISTDPQAHCGYLEFTGQGMEAVRKAIEDLEKDMAVVGARVLEEQKRQTEASETVRLRSSGDMATLASIVASAEEGTKTIVSYMSYWMGMTMEPVSIKFNTDFISARLTSDEIIALVNAIQTGEISQNTFLYQLKEGEILPPDRTIEEEKALIEADGRRMLEAQRPTPDENNLGLI